MSDNRKKTAGGKSKSTAKTPANKGQKPICLVGFMGAGKTAAAAALAELLKFCWVDLDEFIEARESRSVGAILENLGESVFREIETDALDEILRIGEKKIIALGGGTWTIAANRKIIESVKCRTIWLDVPFDICWQRIIEANENRPLARDENETRTLFDSRREVYRQAEIHIKITKNKNPAQIAAEIFKQIKLNKPKSRNRIDKTPVSR